MQENLKLKIKEVVENNEFHQAVLDIGYKWWNDTINNPNGVYNTGRITYLDMINYMYETYGWEAAFLILIGKYNYQVNNGGHMQYFDNGYTDGVTGFAEEHDPEMPLHNNLIDYFYQFLVVLEVDKHITTLAEYILCSKVLQILKDFKNINIDDDEYIEEEVEYEDDDGDITYETEEVRNDCYGQITDSDLLKKLDNGYYEICDHFMTILNKWVEFEVNTKGE